jgi:uncharacterized membrane protein
MMSEWNAIMEQVLNWMRAAWDVVEWNKGFMVWNTFLAFIPLVLSLWLFRKGRNLSIFWWLVFLVFILFLPNAPYVLTDIIHMVQQIRYESSIWVITLAVIPLYLLFTIAGFEAYVFSLIKLGSYLADRGQRRLILSAELFIHMLTAIGVYLGRFNRFNSWDFVTKPDVLVLDALDTLTDKRPIVIILVTFVIITGLYWMMKQVTLGIVLRRRYAHEVL